MASNDGNPKAAPPRKTLVGVLGASAALALMVAIPREESGRTVTAQVAPDGHVALTHISGHQYLQSYLDSVAVHTACDGLTRNPDGSPIRAGQHFTEAQCDAMLEVSLTDTAEHVMACAPGLEGHDGPKVASVLLAHNIGWPRYCATALPPCVPGQRSGCSTSGIVRHFNAGEYRLACDHFVDFRNAGGKPALLSRRKRERAICLNIAPARAAWGLGTPNYDGWPPRRFMENASARVHFAQQAEISKECDDTPNQAGMVTEACSFGPPNEIYAPNPCNYPADDNYARLICHEVVHLNGWPENHPR
jgi:lysozyme